jgi:signal peptidase I
LCSLALALLSIYLGPQILGLRAFKASSGNMEPVILPGDHLFADMARYRFTRPARGDLVIFNSPEKTEALQMGRVIGLEGEDLEIRDKKVYVDSRPLSDPWGQHSDPLFFERLRDQRDPEKIPAGTVFVLGDNRDASYDSRFVGPVPLSMIRGRPLYVYWAADKSRIGTPLR